MTGAAFISLSDLCVLQTANYDHCHFLCSNETYFRASKCTETSVPWTNASEIQPWHFCKILQCIHIYASLDVENKGSTMHPRLHHRPCMVKYVMQFQNTCFHVYTVQCIKGFLSVGICSSVTIWALVGVVLPNQSHPLCNGWSNFKSSLDFGAKNNQNGPTWKSLNFLV